MKVYINLIIFVKCTFLVHDTVNFDLENDQCKFDFEFFFLASFVFIYQIKAYFK